MKTETTAQKSPNVNDQLHEIRRKWSALERRQRRIVASLKQYALFVEALQGGRLRTD